MSESESFDAFYARTVSNVTSQMHVLAGDDGLADHAIREAYARAYQQWYEVARSPDSEAWVLRAAQDAYERRRVEAAALLQRPPDAGHDPLSWPGMFRQGAPATTAPAAAPPAVAVVPADFGAAAGRPATGAAAGATAATTASATTASPQAAPALTAPAPPASALVAPAPAASGAAAPAPTGPSVDIAADPDATLAPPSGASAAGPPVKPPGSLFGGPAPARYDDATFDRLAAGHAGPTDGTTAPAWQAADPLGTTRTIRGAGRPSGRLVPSLLGSRRKLILAGAAAAIVLAGGIVYAVGGTAKHGGANPGAGPAAKPVVHMLPAGRTGGRGAIPWPLIGPGWTLAEMSTAQPDANGAASSGGRDIIYLVDPEGGKYRISTATGNSAPELLAWSGNAEVALYAVGGAQTGSTPSYGLLRLSSGTLTPLPLPAGVTALGFTRPDGLNVLGVRQQQGKYLLQRFTLGGDFAASIGSMPRPAGATDVLQGNALSSPDGTTAVWGISGREIQLVSNAGGLIRRLRVPGTGSHPSCTPLSWWDAQTVLAYCSAASAPGTGRLWLVPAGGGTPTGLTGISGSPTGVGDLTGGWQAGGSVFITATTSAQCSTAASGPGGQQILQVGGGGTEQPVRIPGSTRDHDGIVAAVGSRLLVLTQTSCPGTSSLVWYDPARHATTPVLTEPAGEVGVVDAVPFGGGPAATTNGLS
jgi:hypothetical protein